MDFLKSHFIFWFLAKYLTIPNMIIIAILVELMFMKRASIANNVRDVYKNLIIIANG